MLFFETRTPTHAHTHDGAQKSKERGTRRLADKTQTSITIVGWTGTKGLRQG